MLARARQAVNEARLANVEFFRADAEDLPIEDGLIEVAIVNGIFNLNPARGAIFRELARVMRRDHVVYGAELVLQGPLPRDIRESAPEWFA